MKLIFLVNVNIKMYLNLFAMNSAYDFSLLYSEHFTFLLYPVEQVCRCFFAIISKMGSTCESSVLLFHMQTFSAEMNYLVIGYLVSSDTK